LQERGDLLPYLDEREGQAQQRAGAFHAIQVLLELERPAQIAAHELESTVSTQEAVVRDWDTRCLLQTDVSVDRS